MDGQWWNDNTDYVAQACISHIRCTKYRYQVKYNYLKSQQCSTVLLNKVFVFRYTGLHRGKHNHPTRDLLPSCSEATRLEKSWHGTIFWFLRHLWFMKETNGQLLRFASIFRVQPFQWGNSETANIRRADLKHLASRSVRVSADLFLPAPKHSWMIYCITAYQATGQAVQICGSCLRISWIFFFFCCAENLTQGLSQHVQFFRAHRWECLAEARLKNSTTVRCWQPVWREKNNSKNK